MQERTKNYVILILSIPLVASITFTSGVGFFSENFYASETLNWQLQSWMQDMVNLFLVMPCLMISAFLAFKGIG